MNIQDAIDVIESVSGFTDESTPVGEAWLEVLSFIHCRPTAQPEPVAPTNGEVTELVAWLRHFADAKKGYRRGTTAAALALKVTRAANLLERLASDNAGPVPVSERLPGPEDCDSEGRCWWFALEDEEQPSAWYLDGQPPAREIRFYGNTHWLPHHALPTP